MFTLERNRATSKRGKNISEIMDDLKVRLLESSQKWSPGLSVLATALTRAQK